MIVDHVGITCADLEASTRFYDAVLATLGRRRLIDVGVAVGCGWGSQTPDFWLAEPEQDGPHREFHLAFTAADVDAVHAFHAAAPEAPAAPRAPDASPGH